MLFDVVGRISPKSLESFPQPFSLDISCYRFIVIGFFNSVKNRDRRDTPSDGHFHVLYSLKAAKALNFSYLNSKGTKYEPQR